MSGVDSFHAPSHASMFFPTASSSRIYLSTTSALAPYRFDGATSPSSPSIILLNEILTDLTIWDPLIPQPHSACPGYRLLRISLMGLAGSTSKPSTLCQLAQNLAKLLKSLDSPSIATVVGLGLGSSVAVAFASAFPELAPSLVLLSLPIPSPTVTSVHVANKWEQRVQLARRWDMNITGGKACTRWLTSDARGGPEWDRVRRMVIAGGLEGMELLISAQVEAMTEDFDVIGKIRRLRIEERRILMACGSGDETKPEEMDEAAEKIGKDKLETVLIRGARRLVCCEKPGQLVTAIGAWLDN